MRNGERFAAGEELAHGARPLQAVFRHLMEKPRREPQRRDALALEDCPILQGRGARRHHDEPAAVEQRPPDLQGRSIEGGRRELQKDLSATEIGVPGVPDEPHHAAMARCSTPLGRPVEPEVYMT